MDALARVARPWSCGHLPCVSIRRFSTSELCPQRPIQCPFAVVMFATVAQCTAHVWCAYQMTQQQSNTVFCSACMASWRQTNAQSQLCCHLHMPEHATRASRRQHEAGNQELNANNTADAQPHTHVCHTRQPPRMQINTCTGCDNKRTSVWSCTALAWRCQSTLQMG